MSDDDAFESDVEWTEWFFEDAHVRAREEFMARVERLTLLSVVVKLNEARTEEFERAERALAAAIARARSAREALMESTELLELACRSRDGR